MRFNRSNQPLPGFSLDKRDIAARRGLKRREWRLLVTLPIAVVFLGVVIQSLFSFTQYIPGGPTEPVIVERVLQPAPVVRLADAPALPAAQAIDHERASVRELMADRAIIRHEDVLDALTLAWADELLAADAKAAPIPQRVTGRDLVLGVRPETAVTAHGRLLDSVNTVVPGGDRSFQRLLIGLDEQQVCQVLAPPEAAALVIGREVLVSGRFLGLATLPTGSTGETALPLIAARIARPDQHDDGSVIQDQAEWRTGMPAGLPDDLWTNVSDERIVLESRPYYYLIGQTKVDLQTPEELATAESGNARADDIHTDPPAFRGKPFTVTGYVFRAWEDDNVRRDQPFGVVRAQRILLWSRDFGKVTELIDGRTALKSQILRLYEVCVAGDQPLPQRGDKLSVTGRFFKFRAIPVQPDSIRDARNNVTRQSDNVYTFVFVGGSYTVVPPAPRYEFGLFGIIAIGAATALGLLIYLLRRRDYHLESRVRDQVRSLRKTRLSLRAREQDDGAAPVDRTAPPASEPPPPASPTPTPTQPTP